MYAGYLSYFNVAYSERKESPVYYPGNPIINFYSSGVTAGVNLVFYQRFLIGFNYSRELSYSIQFDEEYQIFGSFEYHWSGRIGYYFMRKKAD